VVVSSTRFDPKGRKSKCKVGWKRNEKCFGWKEAWGSRVEPCADFRKRDLVRKRVEDAKEG
jgi:hypothetical protein